MTVIVKITSGENKADENVSKGFELIPIAAGMRAAFIRDDEGKGWLNVHGNDDHGEERLLVKLPVLGNAYIMDGGKTVATFSSANIPDMGNFYPDSPDALRVLTPTSEESPAVVDTSEQRTQQNMHSEAAQEVRDFIIATLYGDAAEVTMTNDEDWFVTGLAAAIVTYRQTNVRNRQRISLEYLGSARFDDEQLVKLQEQLRICADPVGLEIRTDHNDYIRGYTVDAYANRYDVSEGDLLLLRNLRNKQVGLLKNMIDKIIKYYKAGVSVVPLEPTTTITDTQRERIRHTLYEVLRTNFNFIVADEGNSGKTTEIPSEDSAQYTHVVIRFNR